MCRQMIRVAVVMLVAGLSESVTWGQFGGSSIVGLTSDSVGSTDLPLLNRKVAEGFIAIDGSAEVRVKPTEVRIVFAVTSEGKTAQECHTAIAETIQKLKSSWSEMGIPDESIVEDFIAVLPIYKWSIEKLGGDEVGVEKKAGFRMQTNVHLAVPNDKNAAKTFQVAFEHGVTDIIAFDYWSKELDETKIKAREQAIKAARSKSDQLFAALFDTAPPIINVQEQTTVHYPKDLYDSFVTTHDEEVSLDWRRNMSFIRAHRPSTTYYRGLSFDGDIQSRDLPMHPEISVVSMVRLYFKSGAANPTKHADEADNN